MSSRQAVVPSLVLALALAGVAPTHAEGIAIPRETPANQPSAVPRKQPRKSVDEALAREIYELTSADSSRLEALVKEVLCTYIENPETVRVALSLGSPIERMAGRIRRVEVSLEDSIVKKLRLKRGFIVLENIVLDLPKLVRDRKFRFREKGHTEFLFEVGENDLNELLRVKEEKLKVRRAQLRLENGRMVFQGRLRVLFFNNHVKLDGHLFARKGTEVHFTPRTLKLDFLPVPSFLLGIIRKKINPIADLKNFRFDLDIGAIRTTKSRLLLGSPGVTDYIESEVLAERQGLEREPAAWPPVQFSSLLHSGEGSRREESDASRAAERILRR